MQFNNLKNEFKLSKTTSKSPKSKGAVCIYYDSTWWEMELPKPSSNDVVDSLDVARLQKGVLEPIFGIKDPRTDENISFVGGIRGTAELEKLVNSGKVDLAISMYPTSIQELLDVSDQGELMPPKSTWFEPKIKSGFIVHTF